MRNGSPLTTTCTPVSPNCSGATSLAAACQTPCKRSLNRTPSPNYGIEQAIVLHEGNVENAGAVSYLPTYMAMCLEAG